MIPLLSKRTTLRHKLDQNSSADDSLNDVLPKRGRTDNGSSFNIQKLKDDVEIGDNVRVKGSSSALIGLGEYEIITKNNPKKSN